MKFLRMICQEGQLSVENKLFTYVKLILAAGLKAIESSNKEVALHISVSTSDWQLS